MGSFRKVYNLKNLNLKPVFTSVASDFHRLFTSMATNNSSVTLLTQRLNDAERNIRLLTVEVKKIRMELNRLSSNNANNLVENISDYSSSNSYSKKRPKYDEIEGPPFDKRQKKDFQYEGDYVVVYTDGACPSNGKNGAKAGLGVWWGDGHPLNISKPTRKRNTNNTAEIEACAEACRVAADNGVRKLLIKTDSNFTISCMTKWINGWKKKNWRKADGKEVINKEDLIELEKESNRLEDVKYEHVNGHAGIYGNEEADKLAVRGAEMN